MSVSSSAPIRMIVIVGFIASASLAIFAAGSPPIGPANCKTSGNNCSDCMVTLEATQNQMCTNNNIFKGCFITVCQAASLSSVSICVYNGAQKPPGCTPKTTNNMASCSNCAFSLCSCATGTGTCPIAGFNSLGNCFIPGGGCAGITVLGTWNSIPQCS